MTGPDTPTDVPTSRSAENWFLDAATYARDGDVAQAIAAARSGIAVLLNDEPNA